MQLTDSVHACSCTSAAARSSACACNEAPVASAPRAGKRAPSRSVSFPDLLGSCCSCAAAPALPLLACAYSRFLGRGNAESAHTGPTAAAAAACPQAVRAIGRCAVSIEKAAERWVASVGGGAGSGRGADLWKVHRVAWLRRKHGSGCSRKGAGRRPGLVGSPGGTRKEPLPLFFWALGWLPFDPP